MQTACAEVKKSRETRNQNLVAWINKQLQDPVASPLYFVSEQARKDFEPLQVDQVGKWAQANADLTEVTSLGRPHFRKYLTKVCHHPSSSIHRVAQHMALLRLTACFYR